MCPSVRENIIKQIISIKLHKTANGCVNSSLQNSLILIWLI